MNLQQRATLRHPTVRRPRRLLPALGAASVLVLAACTSGGGDATAASTAATDGPSSGGEFGVQYEKTGTGPMVEPTIPTTPDVPSYFGEVSCDGGQETDAEKPLPEGCQRTFDLTAKPVTQKIANFPLKTAIVWGYAAAGGKVGSPGPTLISYEGEQVQIKVTNELPDATTIHVHGLHQPNESDGVAGISQPEPVKAGASFDYPAFVPGHVGSFAYHSHFQTAVQDMRGLVGMWDVLPREQHESVKADVDVNMTLQIWGWAAEGSLVQPFGTGLAKQFPIDSINGKTGDAAEGTIEVEEGDRVRIRIYNASQEVHAMHLHGHDELAVSKNGHQIPLQRETTQAGPGRLLRARVRREQPRELGVPLPLPAPHGQRHEVGLQRRPGRHDPGVPLQGLRRRRPALLQRRQQQFVHRRLSPSGASDHRSGTRWHDMGRRHLG